MIQMPIRGGGGVPAAASQHEIRIYTVFHLFCNNNKYIFENQQSFLFFLFYLRVNNHALLLSEVLPLLSVFLSFYNR